MSKNPTQPNAQEAAAEWVAVAALKPWTKNPRPIKPKHVRDLMRSIKRFGFGAPLLARREDGEIIAGHARLEAAKRLRLDIVPVRYLDITASEAHVLALADNKLQENREWDDKALAAVIDELEDFGADLTQGTGFDDDEIDKLLGAEEPGGGADQDASSKMGGGLAYRIVIECDDDMHQVELMARFEADGLKCKPLMS
jgi:ParB-like chromosome segregation protein Spo0J